MCAGANQCVQGMYVGPNDDLYAVALRNFGYDPALATRVVDMAVFTLVADAVQQSALTRGVADLDQAIQEVKSFIEDLVRGAAGCLQGVGCPLARVLTLFSLVVWPCAGERQGEQRHLADHGPPLRDQPPEDGFLRHRRQAVPGGWAGQAGTHAGKRGLLTRWRLAGGSLAADACPSVHPFVQLSGGMDSVWRLVRHVLTSQGAARDTNLPSVWDTARLVSWADPQAGAEAYEYYMEWHRKHNAINWRH